MTQCEKLWLLAGASGSTGQTGASGQTGLTGGIRFWLSIDKCADMVGHQSFAVEGRHVTQSERLRLLAGASGSTGQTGAFGQTGLTGGS